MVIISRIRRIFEIIRNEGIKEAIATIHKVLIGIFCYQKLKLKKYKKYHLRNVQGSKMILAINDPGVSKDLIIRGRRERLETRMMQQTLKSGMTVIDIGANIGYYALMEAKAVTESGHVYAIEPEPRNFELLCKNVKLNNYRHIDIFQVGISDETGFANLYVSEHSNLHNLLRPLKASNKDSVIKIKTYRLDDFISEHNIMPSNINIIRMDIEGHEVKALEGMINTLRETKMINLFIEFHPQYIKDIPGYSLESTMDLLVSQGFKIRYATATARNGYSMEFQNISIKDFLSDKNVSRNYVFMMVLSKKRLSEL